MHSFTSHCFFAELHHGFYLFVYKGSVANLFSLVAHPACAVFWNAVSRNLSAGREHQNPNLLCKKRSSSPHGIRVFKHES